MLSWSEICFLSLFKYLDAIDEVSRWEFCFELGEGIARECLLDVLFDTSIEFSK